MFVFNVKCLQIFQLINNKTNIFVICYNSYNLIIKKFLLNGFCNLVLKNIFNCHQIDTKNEFYNGL